METTITDKEGKTIAYLKNNVVIDATQKRVIGLVLGNCLFGKFPYPVGKFFKNTFRNIEGEIIAIINPIKQEIEGISETEIINAAWQILTEIKDHICGWVQEKPEWSQQNLTDYLSHQ
jgi:hypothetical protein